MTRDHMMGYMPVLDALYEPTPKTTRRTPSRPPGLPHAIVTAQRDMDKVITSGLGRTEQAAGKISDDREAFVPLNGRSIQVQVNYDFNVDLLRYQKGMMNEMVSGSAKTVIFSGRRNGKTTVQEAHARALGMKFVTLDEARRIETPDGTLTRDEAMRVWERGARPSAGFAPTSTQQIEEQAEALSAARDACIRMKEVCGITAVKQLVAGFGAEKLHAMSAAQLREVTLRATELAEDSERASVPAKKATAKKAAKSAG